MLIFQLPKLLSDTFPSPSFTHIWPIGPSILLFELFTLNWFSFTFATTKHSMERNEHCYQSNLILSIWLKVLGCLEFLQKFKFENIFSRFKWTSDIIQISKICKIIFFLLLHNRLCIQLYLRDFFWIPHLFHFHSLLLLNIMINNLIWGLLWELRIP